METRMDYRSLNEAGQRAAKLSRKLTGQWFVIVEAGVYHVLSDLEAWDEWCVNQDQILAVYEDGEYQE